MRTAVLLLVCAAADAQYAVEKRTIEGAEAIVLRDGATATEVVVVPSFGNNAVEMTVRGKKILWCPRPRAFGGNPFLWPWANRLDGESYVVNGKKFLLNPELGNYRKDGNRQPIHGLVSSAKEWVVESAKASDAEAEVTSRLDFWKYPRWMAQFPFAHEVKMTYRLSGGVLEVETAIRNLSTEAMPVFLGYHPYFQLTDSPRDEWRVHIAAKERMTLSAALIPTGERTAVSFAESQPLAGLVLDDVFASLDDHAVFRVEGKRERIEVAFGAKFRVAVVYAPAGGKFVCFEPMTAPTNAFRLASEEKWEGLESVPPGGTWKESFRIRPGGF